MRSVGWLCLGCMVAAGCAPRAGTGAAAAATQPPVVPAASAGAPHAAGAVAVHSPSAAGADATSSVAGASGGAVSEPEAAGAGGASGAPALQPMAAAGAAGATGTGTGTGGSGASAGLVTQGACPAPPADATPAEIDALNLVNTVRLAAGSSCVTLDRTVSQAAAAHCAYYAQNKDNDPLCVDSPHYEIDGCAGFTGITPADRMQAAGFMSNAGGEVMAFWNDPFLAIQMWVDSVWHRIPILDPATTVIGYGGADGCDAIDFSPGKRDMKNVVIYPYNGQTDVTPTFDGSNEGEPPPEPSTGWPSSNPISLYAWQLNVTEHQLFIDGDPTPIEHTWLDPKAPTLGVDQQRILRNMVFMYANKPFIPNTRYRVKIAGTYAGGMLQREWTFTTGTGPQRRMRP